MLRLLRSHGGRIRRHFALDYVLEDEGGPRSRIAPPSAAGGAKTDEIAGFELEVIDACRDRWISSGCPG